MKPENKNGEIIYEGNLGYIERYFKDDPSPKYVLYDKMHGGKINSSWDLKGFRKYAKYLRNFYNQEIKRNRHNVDALLLCKKTIEAVDNFEKKLNYLEKRHKAHMNEYHKHKRLKEKRQREWETMMEEKKRIKNKD